MSLDALQETLKQFLLKYKESHSSFDLNTVNPLQTHEDYQGADIGNSPNLVYYSQFFMEDGHGWKTKAQILKEQAQGRWTPAFAGVAREKGEGTPGWTVHLLQPSNLEAQDTETPRGFSLIPRKGRGTPQGDLVPRPPLEIGTTFNEYLSIFQKAREDEYSPYHGETGMTPEDWITAFMIHLSETGKPLDDWENGKESISYLTGAFFRSSIGVPCGYWFRSARQADLIRIAPHNQGGDIGARSSVVV